MKMKLSLRTSALLVAATAGIVALALSTAGPARMLLPSGWKIAPAGNSVPVGDMLAGGELSPDRRWIAFASVGQGVHKVYVVDAISGELRDTAPLPRGWMGLAWTPTSDQLLVSGGTVNTIHRFSVSESGKLAKGAAIPIPGIAANKGWLSGLAISGSTAYVLASASDTLIKIDLANGAVLGRLTFAEESSPYQIRLARDGRAFVSLQGADQVAVVATADLAIEKLIPTGRHPNDLLVLGDRLFVACGNDDAIDVFDLYSGNREERVITRPWPEAPAGSTPNALAASPDAKRLYVANSDNNAVAVMDIARRGRTEVEGFIPTAAYPSALATLADGRVLIGSSKGFGTGPNGKTEQIDPIAPKGYPYIVTLLSGTLALVDASDEGRLRDFTKTVLSVSKYKPGIVERPYQAPARGSNPIPSRLGDPSPIKHILYIIKENRTYDQVLGSLTKYGRQYGNGDPKLNLFGDDVAPNHRQLAKDFVLLDNLYASGEVSVDGHHWTNGAYVTDFMQRTWPQQYSGGGSPRLTESLARTPNDRIWDQVRRAGLTYRTYYYHTKDRMNEDWAKARRSGVRDYEAVDIFIKEFREFEQKGTMPNFMAMALSEDHTSGTRPGAATPQAAVGSNDLGLGKIVEAISSSSLWNKFAIFVIEDDAQNGPDHVDAHRTVGLVLSPYTRNAGIDSTMYTTTSMLRTIELILGASPMSQFDAAATPMYRSFKLKPDLTPYRALKPTTDLLAKNPARKEPNVLASIDFSEPDRLDLRQEIALNQAIWRSVKGNAPYPGAVRRFGFGGPEAED